MKILERGRPLRWDLVEEGIVFLDEADEGTINADEGAGAPTLEFQDLGTGETSRLAVLPNAVPDRRWVIYTGWEPPEAHIMLVEGFR